MPICSNEGDPSEPVHIHADRGDAETKFWPSLSVQVANSDGFDRCTPTELMTVVENHHDEIEGAWNEHFG